MKDLLLLCLFMVMLAGVATAQTDLRVFPNPAVDHFEVSSTASVATITVVNMIGKRVRQFAYVAGQHYEVADLPRGMYLVQFADTNNKVITTLRMNKQ